MVTKDNIKELITSAQTDILFEKFASLLPDDSDFVYEPQGLFNKGILNDTGRVTKKKGNLFIEIYRAGLYDILPKGLFHNKLDDLNNRPEFIEKIDSERNTIRNLFLPFDSEIFSFRAKIEKENLNHFRNTYDSEIAISLMEFFRFFKEMNLLSIYELLFIDIVILFQKRNVAFNVNSILKKLLSRNSSLHLFTVRMIETTDGDSKILRLLNAIPYAPTFAGELHEMQNLLQYVLNQKVAISKVKTEKKIKGSKNNSIGESVRINVDSNSLLLGHVLCDVSEKYVIQIEMTPENMYLNHHIKYGCIGQFIQLFMDYFQVFSSEYEIKYIDQTNISGTNSKSNFVLEQTNSNRISKLAKYKEQIVRSLEGVSISDKAFLRKMEIDLNISLMNYFSMFYEHIFKDEAKQALLNMNTKI